MLWQRTFSETSYRFLFGLVLLTATAALIVLGYPRFTALLEAARGLSTGGSLGRQIAESAARSATYPGYIQAQWFRQNAQMSGLFAAIIGTGSLLGQNAATQLFTLSLPVTRARLSGLRAMAGLSQVFVLAMVPAVVITLISPLVGQRFPLVDTLAYAVCLFAGTAGLFALTFLLSTVFSNVWAPVLIALCVAMALQVLDAVIGGEPRYSLVTMTHGDAYARGEGLPWLMLLATALITTGLLYGAVRNIVRRDF